MFFHWPHPLLCSPYYAALSCHNLYLVSLPWILIFQLFYTNFLKKFLNTSVYKCACSLHYLICTGGEQLQKAFDDIFRGQMSPIVIAVGYNESAAKELIVKVFKTSKEYRSRSQQIPPTVVSCTVKELKKKSFQWAKNSTKVENTIAKNLQNDSQFVFYRLGLYSGVSCNVTEAANVVCHEMCWPHYLLVVGDDIGLEEELKDDIQIVAAVAGLNNVSPQKFFFANETEEYCYYYYGRYYGEKAVYTLLVAPSAEFLTQALEDAISFCNATTLTIIYSGHGEEDGSWAISGDDKFSGSDLLEVLNCVKPQHTPRINILLNSCYGFAFAEEIGYLKILNTGLSLYLPDILKSNNACVPQDIEDKNIVVWAKKYVSEPQYEDSDNWYKVNECITRGVHRLIHLGGKSLVPIDYLSYQISVLPFSAGWLDGCGILPKLFTMENIDTIIDWSKARPHQPPKLPDRSPVDESSPENPHIIVFPAANGDSTLFRWHNFNMLVDGGLKTSPPCFSVTVSCLPKDQKLDVVVVTHYDADHIAGVLSMFNRSELPITVDKLYTVTLEPSTEPTSRSVKQGRTLLQCANNHNVETNDLVTSPTTAIIERQFNDGSHHLRVFMLTPNQQNLVNVKKELMRGRSLTLPNLASASLLIECKISVPGEDNKYMYALLTGDAPGANIKEGLRQVRIADPTVEKRLFQDGHYNFVYIDIPHHGSRKNNPKEFLQNISTKVCVISTDSKKYAHPDDETLKELSKSSTVDHLLFTYQKNRPNKPCNWMNSLKDFRGRYHFSSNDNYHKNKAENDETRCWIVNLATERFRECDCNSFLHICCNN